MRDVYNQLVSDEVKKRKAFFYDSMAIKIQARWKGYITRKKTMDFQERKQYLEGIKQIVHILLLC